MISQTAAATLFKDSKRVTVKRVAGRGGEEKGVRTALIEMHIFTEIVSLKATEEGIGHGFFFGISASYEKASGI